MTELSWNVMPLWVLKVYVRPSSEIVHSVATSPMILGYSWGSNWSSVL